MTFQMHVDRWHDCLRCPLGETRNKIVLARGQLPCSILFVGEAPGESEDSEGLPFHGPAGKLMDVIIQRAIGWMEPVPRYALTNLVCCMPKDDRGNKTGEPEDSHVKACKPRLEEFIGIAKPKLVVCVGKLSKEWIAEGRGMKNSIRIAETCKTVHVIHPAAIIKGSVAVRDLLIQQSVVRIRCAAQEM